MYTFTTTAGDVIEIKPISLLDLQLAELAVRKEFEANGQPIKPPKYAVEVLGGEVEWHEYNEETIQDASDEDKAKWQDHLKALSLMGEEIQKRTAYVFLEGMVIELPKDDKWLQRRKKLFGEDIPTNEDDVKLSYANNILLKTPADKLDIMIEIQKLSLTGVSEEAIQAMENLFRGQMAKSSRQVIKQSPNKKK